MEVRAVGKNVAISPSKVRLLSDVVRGKRVEDALALLRFSPSMASKAMAKTIKSAAANAENNFQMLPSELRITEVFVNKGRTLKRYRPRARGKVNVILKRYSHIVIVVSERGDVVGA